MGSGNGEGSGLHEKVLAMETTLTARAQRKAAQFIDWLVMQGLDRKAASHAVETFAHGIAGKRVKTQAPATGAQEVIATYVECYQVLYRNKPIITPGAAACAARLARQFETELVKAIVGLYFKDGDPFSAKEGHPLWGVERAWPRLYRQHLKASTTTTHVPGCQHRPPCATTDAHNRRYLDELGRPA
jgi:hypothetical protein